MGYLDDKGLEHFWRKVKGYMDARPDGDVNSSYLVKAIIGTIVIWSGAADNIPTGWHLCDGKDGTPDLRDKFVLGAGEKHPVGETGGEEEVTLTVEQMPKHRHSVEKAYGELSNNLNNILGGMTKGVSTISEPTSYIGSSQPHPNMPPYYALCYIMKMTEGGTGGGASEDVYSTEETRIGTWIDGKPLYRRVINGVSPSKVQLEATVGPVIENIKIKQFNGVIDTEYNNRYIPINCGTLTRCFFFGNYFQMEVSESAYTNHPVIIVLEYTKTTD